LIRFLVQLEIDFGIALEKIPKLQKPNREKHFRFYERNNSQSTSSPGLLSAVIRDGFWYNFEKAFYELHSFLHQAQEEGEVRIDSML
jgi:phage-related protein